MTFSILFSSSNGICIPLLLESLVFLGFLDTGLTGFPHQLFFATTSDGNVLRLIYLFFSLYTLIHIQNSGVQLPTQGKTAKPISKTTSCFSLLFL